MADIKTKKNDGSVIEFLNTIEPEKKRLDSFHILKIMKEITESEPSMYGGAIIGLGDDLYIDSKGVNQDWFKIGFSPRKQSITLYLMTGYQRYPEILTKLGKHKTSKACLYINKLEDVDIVVLKELITVAYNETE
jgi:hypothetical protein